MARYCFKNITTSNIKESNMDYIRTIGKETLHLAEIETNPTQTTVFNMSDAAKGTVIKLNVKNSSVPIKQERMNRPQVLNEKPLTSKELIFDKAQLSKETDFIRKILKSDSKDDGTDISSEKKRCVSEEKIWSGIKEEERTLEELRATMEKYLRVSQDVANAEQSSNEGRECSRKEYPKDEAYFTPLSPQPSKLQLQTYKHALEDVRGAKKYIRKLLHQLYEATELTYQSKQGSEDRQNYYEALFEMWIKWSRSQSENTDGDTQFLEMHFLGMFRSIALKLQSAFMDLMLQVQGLPSSLQDKLQQACYDMQELHSTFSLSNRFGDLDKYHLTQSQLKLTQAQGSIEKLFCFLEGSISSSWDRRTTLPH